MFPASDLSQLRRSPEQSRSYFQHERFREEAPLEEGGVQRQEVPQRLLVLIQASIHSPVVFLLALNVLLLMLGFMFANFMTTVLFTWMPAFVYGKFHLSLAMAGFTATATSPSIVSGRVVATVMAAVIFSSGTSAAVVMIEDVAPVVLRERSEQRAQLLRVELGVARDEHAALPGGDGLGGIQRVGARIAEAADRDVVIAFVGACRLRHKTVRS